MNPSVFDLVAERARKADPALIADDEKHLAAISAVLEHAVTDLSERLAEARRASGRGGGDAGGEALVRDQEIHRLTARLALLRRFGVDLCLGRMVRAGGTEPVYIGRTGLSDPSGAQLLVDWRSPAAEPFFGATLAEPMGLLSRRRYRWTRGRISDYWDEVFAAIDLADPARRAALDDQSAFIASLGASRTPRMRDVLGTIAADQDVIIRAGSEGALVVDGGPGTGKTVVALHRTAYLMYADPRLGRRRGGVLVVGPHRPYLTYVSDVLPSLGEEGVATCTLRDLVPEGTAARPERDPEVACLKSDARMVSAIEPAVAFYEEPPTEPMTVETPWAEIRLNAADWAEAFAAPDPGTPHNEALGAVWEALLAILVDACGADEEVPEPMLRRSLAGNRDLVEAFRRAWPILDYTELVGDLWSVPAYLRRCAPWLDAAQVRTLQRAVPDAWTVADLPLLDAARRRLGDPEESRRRRQRAAMIAADRERMASVIDEAIAADDSEMLVMSMLRGADLQAALVDPDALPQAEPDRLAGPFAHIVVDEAQELTDAEWQMVLSRCPSASMTIAGDRAQARRGFGESWRERLERAGVRDIRVATLGVNYRTPREVMAEAEPVIRAVLPDANVPTSIRASGRPVRRGRRAELDPILDSWTAEHADGTACVIAAAVEHDDTPPRPRVRWLTPELCKGLEFDLVVLIDPEAFGDGDRSEQGRVTRAVDRYVAMTRATGQLVILDDRPGNQRPRAVAMSARRRARSAAAAARTSVMLAPPGTSATTSR